VGTRQSLHLPVVNYLSEPYPEYTHYAASDMRRRAVPEQAPRFPWPDDIDHELDSDTDDEKELLRQPTRKEMEEIEKAKEQAALDNPGGRPEDQVKDVEKTQKIKRGE
jgi:hypothetical protein